MKKISFIPTLIFLLAMSTFTVISCSRVRNINSYGSSRFSNLESYFIHILKEGDLHIERHIFRY